MYAVHPDEQWLGDPQAGDFNQGAGTPTAALSNPNVTLAGARAFTGTPWAQSPGIWIVAALILVVFGVIHAKHKDEYKTPRVGLESWFMVGLMAATWIYVFKTGATAVAGMPKPLKQFFGAL